MLERLYKGDRVVLIRDHPDHREELLEGDTGTVLADWPGDMREWIPVRYDHDFGGHTCGDLCEDGYGWHTPAQFLARISPEIHTEKADAEIEDEDIASTEDLREFIFA